MKTLLNRLFDKVSIHSGEECWLFNGALTTNGYGQLWDVSVRRARPAHRISYELLVGEIPAGFDLDHLCRVRHCVNPSHLEVCTRKENTRRGIGPSAVNAAKTHCSRGHEFTVLNTVWEKCHRGTILVRRCRECRILFDRKRRLKGTHK